MPSEAQGADSIPPLSRDRAFYGVLVTQFLGAFNDNLFKQLVLLICVTATVNSGGGSLQGYATALFSLPFVLFSGVAGFLSDRVSKYSIIVSSKVAEVVIMSLGGAALMIGQYWPELRVPLLFVVLFLMGTQSAFFGPSKYGILPEMFRNRDLPHANGVIQMTTFLAIIFGAALAGFLKDWYGDAVWLGTIYCVGIAVVGTVSSLFLRKTPIAKPELQFDWSAWIVTKDVWRMIGSDRQLLGVLLISSVFWFLGGLTQQTANTLGKAHLGWSDTRTSLMVATIGLGICLGCVSAAAMSKDRVSFGVTKIGTWGLILSFVGLWWICPSGKAVTFVQKIALPIPSKIVGDIHFRPEAIAELLVPLSGFEWKLRGLMLLTGLSAGMFVVPLQVFMQSRPPAEYKGRMIGAMNLINWIGIVCSGLFFSLATALLNGFQLPFPWLFPVMAAFLLPIGLFYRPRSEALSV
ncbi:MFS transporter [Thalassoroseus pseudoceratinae]|uniref:MFS transporter n=1 Tax=Thalassoroseus pseudoceratinae TaxID=2713176 RepID=UPI00142408CC|nr:MFS transporter [Thalassoroseus pseudoceratinae]